MAMTTSQGTDKPAELLNSKAARLAGLVSVLLGLLGIAAVVLFLAGAGGESVALRSMAAGQIAFLLFVAAAGIQLTRGKIWAQRFLLVVWLAGLVGVACLVVAAMLWGRPTWWGPDWSMPVVLASIAVLVTVATGLLVWASAADSRLRYATYVGIAIAAAVALTLVVNMFSQTTYVRRDVESLQRFALSQRTKRILEAINKPVRLTCVYTAIDEKAETPARRARVMDLLGEMHETNGLIDVANVETDARKAVLIERLRRQRSGKAEQHARLLADFQDAAGKILASLNAQQQSWEQLVGRSYLDQWGLTAEISRGMKEIIQRVEEASAKTKGELDGTGLPEYAKLVEQAQAILNGTSQTLRAIAERTGQVGKIPPAIRANRDSALASANESMAAARAMVQAIGEPTQAPPADSAAAFRKFVPAAEAAAAQFTKTARSLDEIAGKELVPFVRNSQAWLVKGNEGRKAVLPDGTTVMLERNTISDLYDGAAAYTTRRKTETEGLLKVAKADYQTEALPELRKIVAAMSDSITSAGDSLKAAIDTLSKIDEPTEALLAETNSGKAFDEARKLVEELLERIDKLPKLEADSFATSITGQNIVILETADKAEVVDFQSVWPLEARAMEFAEGEGLERRVFNGDAAISSRVLSLTQEPFATVLLTHYRPEVPPEMERMIPVSPISPQNLTALGNRLKEANFQVEEWNLAQDRPKAEPADRPQVLLVLPPPNIPPAPARENQPAPFGEEHLDKIRKAIDAGTPAIFLTQFFWPRQPAVFLPPVSAPYPMRDYLKKDWGIDVQTDRYVVPAVADANQPGRFKIDPFRVSYVPLNAFADDPIGRPLRGQRTFWQNVAPVSTVRPLPDGVTVEPLLSVPESWNGTWATDRVVDLVAQFRRNEESFVSPNVEAGDTLAPFDVAVTAKRDKTDKVSATTQAGTDKVSAARIVVLGIGAGLIDGYLDERVAVLKTDRTVTMADPPRANADVVVNSVYWLAGRDHYIARGPAPVKPVEMIPKATMTAIQLACLVALPAVALALGGAVMFIRRR